MQVEVDLKGLTEGQRQSALTFARMAIEALAKAQGKILGQMQMECEKDRVRLSWGSGSAQAEATTS